MFIIPVVNNDINKRFDFAIKLDKVTKKYCSVCREETEYHPYKRWLTNDVEVCTKCGTLVSKEYTKNPRRR